MTKGQGHKAQKTVPAWAFALLWVLTSSSLFNYFIVINLSDSMAPRFEPLIEFQELFPRTSRYILTISFTVLHDMCCTIKSRTSDFYATAASKLWQT